MGLTVSSVGSGCLDQGLHIVRDHPDDVVIALAGNPNVGKSTVFNALTGMNQHVGNWPGKTVSSAQGVAEHCGRRHILVDLPGTYSLLSHSAEEEIARDFLCFGAPDCTIVVADATCLERNLNLVLQITEITTKVVLCVNLMDEADKKGISLDLSSLEAALGIPVVPCAAREGRGLSELLDAADAVADGKRACTPSPIRYSGEIANAATVIADALPLHTTLPHTWLSLRLLEENESLSNTIEQSCDFPLPMEAIRHARAALAAQDIDAENVRDRIVAGLVLRAEEIACDVVTVPSAAHVRDRKIDRILTSRSTGIPIMLLALGIIFFLTITGANYPSQALSKLLFSLDAPFFHGLTILGAPAWLQSLLVDGVWRSLAWVVSVMLPPMAIFFPLFTLLEDLGYLPRVAFNLDHYFKKAHACGKQCLTMCMGIGCNAAGIVGCRIIDSPRERLIAILTNNFVPCNGRFPTLIALISMFCIGAAGGFWASAASACALVGVLILGVGVTLLLSRVLSATILKGVPSSFTLELPPYRVPQLGKVVVRSIFDRTLFVLGRAAIVAAPAGLILWLLAHITVQDTSLLTHCAVFLDPFARLLGLDGVILLAFILGFPANEIVLPIILMCYLSTGQLTDWSDLTTLHSLLVANGWTGLTALCTMLFSLLHWPCSTTCLTIHKETGSIKWTLLSFFLPTVVAVLTCFVVASVARLLGLSV